MRRREFVAAALSATVVSPAAAQQDTKIQRLAVFSPFQPVAMMQENSSNRYYRAIVAELRRLGHIEGENLIVERYGKEQKTASLDADAAQEIGRAHV